MSTLSLYSTLERGYVRILTLHSGSGKDPIRCTLAPIAIEDASSSYVALSYVWGPEPEEYLEITVGEDPFDVRPNLHHALLALRHPIQSQRFWIDAICINQKSLPEKNLQVPLMTQIYTNSSYVLIWLGETANDSNYVMECIHRQDQEAFKQRRFLTGMARIVKRDWFQRTWILQEFGLNTASPQILCGDGVRVTWEDFERAYPKDFPAIPDLLDEDFAIEMTDSFRNNPAIYFLSTLRKSFHFINQQRSHFDEYTFPQAVQSAMRCDVTDPKDKIFGVLGLINKQTRDEIVVDYNKTTGEVFQDAMVRMLDIERNPRIYARFPIPQTSLRKERSTPSWVLDFHPESSDFTVFVQVFKFAPPEPPPLIRPIQLHRSQLSVKGLYLGQIDGVLEAKYPFRTATPNDFSMGGIMISQLRNYMSFLLGLETFVNDHLGTTREFKLVEPLWKTLIVSKSSESAFGNETDYNSQWETLLGLARAYQTLPIDDIVDFFRLKKEIPEIFDLLGRLTGLAQTDPIAANAAMAAITRQEAESLNLIVARQDVIYHLQKFMANYTNTQPLNDYLRMVLCNQRSFFVASNGWYGIGNPGGQKGDHLALLFPDMYMPFILRENGSHFEMVGIAYVPPSMKDKAIETRQNEIKEFVIV